MTATTVLLNQKEHEKTMERIARTAAAIKASRDYWEQLAQQDRAIERYLFTL